MLKMSTLHQLFRQAQTDQPIAIGMYQFHLVRASVVIYMLQMKQHISSEEYIQTNILNGSVSPTTEAHTHIQIRHSYYTVDDILPVVSFHIAMCVA